MSTGFATLVKDEQLRRARLYRLSIETAPAPHGPRWPWFVMFLAFALGFLAHYLTQH